MEINVNSVLEKAKETMEVVAKTTKKTAAVQKKKFDVAVVRNKLDKAYQELGKAYFNSLETQEEKELEIAINKVKEVISELQAAKKLLEQEKED